ncbi:hypothetical protein [Streptacidiphilus anmyonensis]|uniref:hypothetical protein n=1 Tax=Streptacidiphilus anmyonensis TaxID=405782 RepID=UPI0005A885C4|nr:hypothetical protein [Streptacidiphilus anmyonensis]
MSETLPPSEQRTAALRARLARVTNSPGLYAGAGLGIASASLSGTPLLATTLTAGAAAASWTALGLNPGPWRWLPGHGEPWQWMARAHARAYRRRVRRMRRRLTTTRPAPPGGALLLPAWTGHPDRASLVRARVADSHRTRTALLRNAWQRALPGWGSDWWRRYTPTELALRAGPLAALPVTGYLPMPWYAHLAASSLAATWGTWVCTRPERPATEDATNQQPADWYVARWEEWIACQGGPLAGSYLVSLDVTADRVSAVVVSTTAKAADSLAVDAISIAFDVPARAVNLYRTEDMAASRAKLTVRLRAAAPSAAGDLIAAWRDFNPYPGSIMVAAEETEFGRRMEFLLPRTGTSVRDVQPQAIVQALDLPGEDPAATMHLRVLGARRLEVSEMTNNPLTAGVPLDLDDLVMDTDGFVTIGRDIYGNPARWRLMIPNKGKYGLTGVQGVSAVHSFVSGTTGAGKTSLEEALLIAQAINGCISWVADGKGGSGYASWADDLDWLVKSPLGFALMASGAAKLGKLRFSVQQRMQWRDADGDIETGRSFFVPGEPFALLQATFDEFNEMVREGGRDVNAAAVLSGVSNLGRQTRAAGIAARVHVQIPNLDAIGSNADANAVRDMLQSGNIALFRTARNDVANMSLGARTPAYRISPIPETFPDGSNTGGLCYIADGGAQYTQSRVAYHHNAAKLYRTLPQPALTDAEADAVGAAYLYRDSYRHLDAKGEEEFLRELIKKHNKDGKTAAPAIVDLAPATPTGATGAAFEGLAVDVEDEDLDDIAPPSRSQLIWHAVHDGARRNKQIAEVTDLKPSNVANGTARLERLGKLHKIDRDWHTREPLDTRA